MSHVEWPAVDPGIAAYLQRLFQSPLQLDAAFDGEAECEELITLGFPDIVDEFKLDVVALLMTWKEDNSRALKRARRDVASNQLFRLPSPGVHTVQDEFQRIKKTSVLCA